MPFTYITTEDEQKVGAEEGDHEGIVNLGRDIEGVEVSIFLHQAEDGAYKVSLRSNNYLKVVECMFNVRRWRTPKSSRLKIR